MCNRSPSRLLSVMSELRHVLTAAATLTLVAAWPAQAIELPELMHSDWAASRSDGALLRRFYALREHRPAWADPATADRLRAAADASAQHGLEPTDYDPDRYAATLPMPADLPADAQRDLALSLAALRLASDLSVGRLQPQAVETDWGIAPPVFDPAAALAAILERSDLVTAFAELAPPHPGYAQLLPLLARYREIAAQGGWPTIDTSGGTADPGDPRLAVVQQRLIASGDLPAEANADLVAGLKRFQLRHGLATDGRAGKDTLAALNVSVEQRIAQIVANLERWRWLPRQFPERYIAVNAADATLDFIDGTNPPLRLRVVVGETKHPTPVLRASIVGVTFNPPWNVPHSIARKEILPKLRRNPGYLQEQNMVIRNGSLDDPFGLGVDWRKVHPERFPYTLQQRPGPLNALGAIKLELPNKFDVYLHDTPSKKLFARAQRFFSHGCIRVDQVGQLAQRLLPADFRAPEAAERGETVTVWLRQSMPVYLLYVTAFDAEGVPQFRRDIYGRDARITAALAARKAQAMRSEGDSGLRVVAR